MTYALTLRYAYKAAELTMKPFITNGLEVGFTTTLYD